MSRDKTKLLYAETHEWVDVAEDGGNKIATIGISGFAFEQLNDLVYMDLPEVGKQLAAGDEFGEVESVKAVSPLYSPVSGEVIEVHANCPIAWKGSTTIPTTLAGSSKSSWTTNRRWIR